LGLKGINFNLNKVLYGYDTIGSGQSSPSKDFKPKLFNAMESDDGHDASQHIDKVNTGGNDVNDNYTKPLDKGKNVDRRVHPIELGPGHCTEPPFVT
jgi:hypothetical protein